MKKTEQIIILILSALALLSFERLFFYLINFEYFSTLNLEITILSFLNGLKIDIITLFTFSVILILPLLYLNRWRQIFGYLFLGVVIGIFTINLGDIAYFPFVNRHLSNEVFLLSNDLDFFTDIIGSYLFEIVIYLLVIYIFYRFWKKILSIEIYSEKYPLSQNILFLFLVILILLLGVRGKVLGKPFGLSDAFVNDNIASANLSLNGLYSIYRGKKRESYKFMSDDLALEKTRNLLQSENTQFISKQFPIERKMKNIGEKRDYNIVIILVESLTSKYVDSFGDENFGVTPYLDKLAKDGISFQNFYANGQRSIEGITSILTGVPSITGFPNLGYGIELSNFSYIGKILKSNGYSTIGMQGSKKRSFRIGTVLNLAGFDEVFGAEDMRNFQKDEKDISLPFGAVWDGNMFRFMKSRIDKSREPFFSFGFTATTHFPCRLPNPKYEIYPHQDFSINGYLNNLKYFDSQLEQFIENSKKESWFKNTVFIITADHTIAKGVGVKKDGLAHFKIPMIIYAPHIFKPQKIETIGTQTDIFPTIIDILNFDNHFSTLSNSLFDINRRFGILREGNRMILLDENRSYQDLDSSKTLKAVLQTLSNLVTENRVFK